MEEVFLRFPHVGEQIFEQMDNKDLKKCTEAGKHLNDFISGQKIPWIRMIHNVCKLFRAMARLFLFFVSHCYNARLLRS